MSGAVSPRESDRDVSEHPTSREEERKDSRQRRSRSQDSYDRRRNDRRRRRSDSRSRERPAGSRRRRSRSRSRDRSYSHRRSERTRSRSRDRRRRRDHSRDRDNGRSHRDYYTDRHAPRDREPPQVNSAEEEQRQLERTYRTVQVYNLSLRAEERDVFEFFKQAGRVEDIKIIRDRTTGRSKGFAYVEFAARDSVVYALSLGGQPLLGQPVMVKMSEAEKNLAWEAAQAAKKQATSAAAAAGLLPAGGVETVIPGRLLVSNLPVNVTEADLRQILDPFGMLDFITVQRDAMGMSVGQALVQYKSSADASLAATKLNEERIELAPGLVMKLDPAPLDFNPMASGIVGAVPPPAVGGTVLSDQLPGVDATLEERIDMDADDGGGMKLTAQHRMALMSRLAATAGIQVPQIPVYPGVVDTERGTHAQGSVPADLALEQGVMGPASPIPTQCLLLKNMFDPNEETEPGWNEEIAEEVRDECSKHGAVEFVHVDANSKGYVYVKFESVAAAAAAQKALHGRWFAQRQLCADFQFTPLFNAHFKL